MKLQQWFIAIAAMVATIASTAHAEPPTQETASAAVNRFLTEHKINPADNWVQNSAELQGTALEKTFHDHRFYLLRFRQWPVARENPPPLQANNIFAVSDALKVTLITNANALLDFFQSHEARKSVNTATAWALLHKELLDDGMFHLKVRPDLIEAGKTIKGESISVPVEPNPRGGNSGQCVFTLHFEADGKFISHDVQNNLKEGMRPRCQSMQLTNPDLAIRKDAERDLLLMGRDALPYLRERLEIVHPSIAKQIRFLIRLIENDGEPALSHP